MYYSRYAMRRALRDSTTIMVDPRRIHLHGSTSFPVTYPVKGFLDRHPAPWTWALGMTARLYSLCYSLEPVEIPGRFWSRVRPVEDEHRYRLIDDLIRHRDDLHPSLWFAELIAEIHGEGVARYKNRRFADTAAVEAFLSEYVLGMIRSLEHDGYLLVPGGDVGAAVIDADGSLVKVDVANHRFAAARILGVSPIPLEVVGWNRDWWQATGAGRDPDLVEMSLRTVEAAHR